MGARIIFFMNILLFEVVKILKMYIFHCKMNRREQLATRNNQISSSTVSSTTSSTSPTVRPVKKLATYGSSKLTIIMWKIKIPKANSNSHSAHFKIHKKIRANIGSCPLKVIHWQGASRGPAVVCHIKLSQTGLPYRGGARKKFRGGGRSVRGGGGGTR